MVMLTSDLARQMTQPIQGPMPRQQPMAGPPPVGPPPMAGPPPALGPAPMTGPPAPALTQEMAHKMYLQRTQIESKKANDLAAAMREAALNKGKAALSSGVASQKASADLKRINAGGPIQAKHPLDLLAIRIRGWKAHKKQKEVTAAAEQAKKDALDAAHAQAAQEKAQERADFMWKEQQKALAKMPEAEKEATTAKMKADYYHEYAVQQKQGIPEDQMKFSLSGTAGQNIVNQTREDSRMQGTGRQVDLEGGVDTGLQKDILSNQAGSEKLTRVEDGFKPEYFGLKGAAGGIMGMISDVAGFSDSELSKFNAERSEYLSSLYQYSNKLIKERSGAAVTAQEWERFKKEFPVGFMGAREFKIRLGAYIDDMAAENKVKLRQGGWEIKNGVLHEKKGAPPMSEEQISKITKAPAEPEPQPETTGDADGGYTVKTGQDGRRLRWKAGMADWEEF